MRPLNIGAGSVANTRTVPVLSRSEALPIGEPVPYHLQAAYAYCRRLTERRGTNFALGFRHLPPGKRRAIYAAYAFCRFADDLSDEQGVRLPASGDYRGQAGQPALLLRRWRQELNRCYRGAAVHPITRALQDALRRHPIPRDVFEGMIAGCEADLHRSRYASFEELLGYCDLVATTIGRICLTVFGHRPGPHVRRWAREFAIALQLTNILRDVGDDLDRGRVYLPQADLRRFGCTGAMLRARRASPAFLALMDFECRRAWRYFRGADRLMPWLSPDARLGARLMRDVYQAVLAKVQAQPAVVLRRRFSITLRERAALVRRARRQMTAGPRSHLRAPSRALH